MHPLRAAWVTTAFAGTLFCVSTALQAQPEDDIELFGREATPQEHLRDILDGSFWSETLDANLAQTRGSRASPAAFTPMQRNLEECEDALAIVRAPDTANPARERLAATRTYRSCVQNARAMLNVVEPAAAARTAAALQPLLDELDEEEEKDEAETQFMGISFGVGIGASFSDDDRISAAEVGADGNIRALEDETQEPRVILESHYYGLCKTAKCNAGERGIGPFFGIVAKDDKLISAFTLGGMLGWKSKEEGEQDGFSVGLGAMLDSNVSSLADGFEEGQPLPEGEDAPVFKKESRWGWVVFFTRTF